MNAKKTRTEHLVVIPVEPLQTSEPFIDWPLHITIVPWFGVEDDRRVVLDNILASIAKRHEAFSAKVGAVEMLGANKNLPVNVIESSKQLQRLHEDVLASMEMKDFTIHQKTFTGSKYLAHITHQGKKAKKQGDILKINRIALVRQLRLKGSGTMVKTLVKEYKLA